MEVLRLPVRILHSIPLHLLLLGLTLIKIIHRLWRNIHLWLPQNHKNLKHSRFDHYRYYHFTTQDQSQQTDDSSSAATVEQQPFQITSEKLILLIDALSGDPAFQIFVERVGDVWFVRYCILFFIQALKKSKEFNSESNHEIISRKHSIDEVISPKKATTIVSLIHRFNIYLDYKIIS